MPDFEVRTIIEADSFEDVVPNFFIKVISMAADMAAGNQSGEVLGLAVTKLGGDGGDRDDEQADEQAQEQDTKAAEAGGSQYEAVLAVEGHKPPPEIGAIVARIIHAAKNKRLGVVPVRDLIGGRHWALVVRGANVRGKPDRGRMDPVGLIVRGEVARETLIPDFEAADDIDPSDVEEVG